MTSHRLDWLGPHRIGNHRASLNSSDAQPRLRPLRTRFAATTGLPNVRTQTPLSPADSGQALVKHLEGIAKHRSGYVPSILEEWPRWMRCSFLATLGWAARAVPGVLNTLAGLIRLRAPPTDTATSRRTCKHINQMGA